MSKLDVLYRPMAVTGDDLLIWFWYSDRKKIDVLFSKCWACSGETNER